MEITRTEAGERVELKLKGRLDAIWSDHVGRALADCVRAGQHFLALDMADVDFLSSAGIRILVIYTKQLKAIHGRLTIVNASEIVSNVLQLAGLGSLLDAEETAAPVAPRAVERGATPVKLALPGATAEVYDLDLHATLKLEYRGEPEAWLAGGESLAARSTVEFPVQAMGLGLGALGAGEASADDRLGEFLAAGGAALCQPADGTHKPDYLLLQGSLTPAVQIAYGLVARGGFRHLLRFDKGTQPTSVPLSVVVQACLDCVGGGAVGLVMVAETAALIGAALQKTPDQGTAPLTPGPSPARGEGSNGTASSRGTSIFSFPAVRDWLSFTAEAALANTTSLVVGVAADTQHAAGLRLLKPMLRSGTLHGHFHAAAFPYRPLRKGRVELPATVGPLFENEQVLSLLHLLNDWRPGNGAGESRFLRGACWCAPLETTPSPPTANRP
jgi:anti-anti-sigma factor